LTSEEAKLRFELVLKVSPTSEVCFHHGAGRRVLCLAQANACLREVST